MFIIELGLYVLLFTIILVGFAVVIKRLAEVDAFFTSLYTNGIKFVDRGGTLNTETGVWHGTFDHMIVDVPGYIIDNPYDPTSRFRKAKEGERQKMSLLNRFLNETLGVYFYGIYPWKHIRTFRINRDTEILTGKKPEEWIRPGGFKVDSVIRFNFPRPFVFTDVELADGQTIHVKVATKIQIEIPYIPAYQFADDFFTQTGSLLQGEVIDTLVENGMDLPTFKSKPKGEFLGILRKLKDPRGVDASGEPIPSEFNTILTEQVGQEIVGITLNDWTPSNDEIRKALEAEAIAAAQGNARVAAALKNKQVTVTEAEAYEAKLAIETRADAARQTALAKSRGAYIRRTVNALKVKDADPTSISTSAADVLTMEAATSETSKITTLVQDRGAITVPVGGDKK